jgi:hypothetical protein
VKVAHLDLGTNNPGSLGSCVHYHLRPSHRPIRSLISSHIGFSRSRSLISCAMVNGGSAVRIPAARAGDTSAGPASDLFQTLRAVVDGVGDKESAFVLEFEKAVAECPVEAAFSAADVEHPSCVEADERRDGARLDPGLVAPVH